MLKSSKWAIYFIGLKERISSGEVVITGEGYLMELCRRGYNQNGSFIPTVSLIQT